MQSWSKTSLKAGDKMAIVIHPMKDSTAYGLMGSIPDPDGKVLKDRA